MNKKIIYQFTIISILLIVSISVLSFYSLKNNNIKIAVNSAEATAQVIKNGLTAYMIDKNMHRSDTFINSVASMKNINELWMVRNQSINKQFGLNEKKKPRDDIDKEVLKTGKTIYSFNDTLDKSFVRITIPYKAVWENGVDCTRCHNVLTGDTLGAISLEFDITNIKQSKFEELYLIPLIIFLGLLFIYFIFRKNLNQYLEIFENLTTSLTLAINGKFEKISYPQNLSTDVMTLMNKFNCLIVSLKETSTDIDKKLKGFIGKESNNASNSLEDSKKIITNLSALYQFKKEIEQDNTKEEIYNRISEILQNQFHISNFTFIEINTQKRKMEIVKQQGDTFYCRKHLEENPQQCRAVRTKNDVLSIDFHSSCAFFEEKEKFHYCLSNEIIENIQLVINFVLDSKEELEELKEKISYIKSYINESTPSIEVKLLMNALQESAFQDSLTGLYNRKFLEEHSKKLILQAKRENFNIGVLLLDMDHFKAVNDEYGHDIGDKVLKELSRILNETVRESDIVIRYGGEEFVILLVNVKTEEDAFNVAEKIRIRVQDNEIDIYAGTKLRKTVSIGLSMYPEDSSTFESVIKNADIALYEAKNQGRNQVVRFKTEQVSSVDLF